MADFDERSGIVCCTTPWGLWYQTLDEVSLEVTVEGDLKSRDVTVSCQSNSLSVAIRDHKIIDVSSYWGP